MASKDSSSDLSNSVECPVCLQPYTLLDRLPKSMVCHHTICNECLDTLKKPTIIMCPTCRQDCDVTKVAVNFAMTDVLSALCQECMGKKHTGTCQHCKKQLCDSCTENHAEDMHKELLGRLDQLSDKITNANKIYMDSSSLQNENRKEEQCAAEIRKEINLKRKELDDLEDKLLETVRATKETNITKYNSWNRSLGTEITKAKDFVSESNSTMGTKYSKRVQVADMIKLKDQGQELSSNLTKLMSGTPTAKDYPDAATDLKSTFTHFNTNSGGNSAVIPKQLASAGNTAQPDYTTLKHMHTVGGEGSGLDQFNKPVGVACVSNMVVVADGKNHRLKWYDQNLNLLFDVGKKGSGDREFSNPCRLAVSSKDELFVADYNKSRVVVLSKNGEYMRQFGQKGAGEDDLDRPLGIALRGGDVFICDSNNYRVKKTTTDGKFIQNIGSKGNLPGMYQNIPTRVAVMSPAVGHILVKEFDKKQLHVFDATGVYLGLFPPTVPPQLAKALSISMTVDTFDNVLVTYEKPSQIAVYDKDGLLITTVRSQGQQPGQFNRPSGIATNTQDGFMVVCDKNNHRLQMFTFSRK